MSEHSNESCVAEKFHSTGGELPLMKPLHVPLLKEFLEGVSWAKVKVRDQNAPFYYCKPIYVYLKPAVQPFAYVINYVYATFALQRPPMLQFTIRGTHGVHPRTHLSLSQY